MKTAELADEFDRILKHLEEWEKDKKDVRVREARRLLDDMHALTKHRVDISVPQTAVLETMLIWLSSAVESAENWCP